MFLYIKIKIPLFYVRKSAGLCSNDMICNLGPLTSGRSQNRCSNTPKWLQLLVYHLQFLWVHFSPRSSSTAFRSTKCTISLSIRFSWMLNINSNKLSVWMNLQERNITSIWQRFPLHDTSTSLEKLYGGPWKMSTKFGWRLTPSLTWPKPRRGSYRVDFFKSWEPVSYNKARVNRSCYKEILCSRHVAMGWFFRRPMQRSAFHHVQFSSRKRTNASPAGFPWYCNKLLGDIRSWCLLRIDFQSWRS